MAAVPNQLTTQEILGLVSQEFYGKDTPDVYDRPSLTNFKLLGNQAYQDVCSELGWNWVFRIGTFNTVPNQTDPYALDAGVQEILWMTLPAYQIRLPNAFDRDWIVNYPGQYNNFQPSQPAFYVMAPTDPAAGNGPRVWLGPAAADQVYTLNYGYIGSPSALAFGANEFPVIPAQWQDLWRLRWLMQLYRFAGPGSNDKLQMVKEAYQDVYKRAWLNQENEEDNVQRFRDLWAENAAWPGRNVGFYLFGRW